MLVDCGLLNYLGILILFMISMFFTPIIAYGQSANSTLVTYGKSIFGLSFKHPEDWEVKGYDRSVRDDRVGYDLFAITCPKSALQYPYKDETFMTDYSQCPDAKDVSIGITKFPKNLTLEEYTDFLNKGNNFTLIDYNLLELNDTLLSSLPAKKIVYSYLGEYNDESEIIKVLNIVTIPGNRAYSFSYHSPILEFDDLMPTVQKIIDSLKITPMPPCNFTKNENSTDSGKCVLSSSVG